MLKIELTGTIGPAGSDFVVRSLAEAERRQATLVILRLDTPGGLDSAMRDIIRAILAAPMPVVGYVAPGGARAASAGTYILYACHVAAMAPATNLGAATPIRLGGIPAPPGGEEPGKKPEQAKPEDTLERKIVNDARAYLRSLAQLRGRNAEWAERAVTEAASLSAEDALKQGVIDLVARDEGELLKQLDGRTLKLGERTLTLATAGETVETLEPGWRTRVLAVITTPEVAYILMLIGIYGLIFELANPGGVLPGVLGGICLLLALFAFQVLPVNYAGLALIALGLAFFISEAFIPSYGILSIGGLVAFVAGSLILWQEEAPGFTVPMGLILGLAMASAAIVLTLGTMLARQRRRPVVSGREHLLGASGVAEEDFQGEGWVRVQGESWRARSDRPLRKGQGVRVAGRDGLCLHVEPKEEEPS
ncbi:MAG TPA: nodulation protein NfeD [Candidatus Competibacteraceae bacterium]|nr:nodulation protein NfeD [Candidatus Competibacteraceae bacterium]